MKTTPHVLYNQKPVARAGAASFKKVLGMLLLAAAFFCLASCSKSDAPGGGGDPTPGKKFDKKYFQVTVLSRTLKHDYYEVKYEIKNTATEDYVYGKPRYWLISSLNATDGTLYVNERLIDDLAAGVSTLESPYIGFPEGKPMNTESFKYEIIEKE